MTQGVRGAAGQIVCTGCGYRDARDLVRLDFLRRRGRIGRAPPGPLLEVP